MHLIKHQQISPLRDFNTIPESDKKRVRRFNGLIYVPVLALISHSVTFFAPINSAVKYTFELQCISYLLSALQFPSSLHIPSQSWSTNCFELRIERNQWNWSDWKFRKCFRPQWGWGRGRYRATEEHQKEKQNKPIQLIRLVFEYYNLFKLYSILSFSHKFTIISILRSPFLSGFIRHRLVYSKV